MNLKLFLGCLEVDRGCWKCCGVKKLKVFYIRCVVWFGFEFRGLEDFYFFY